MLAEIMKISISTLRNDNEIMFARDLALNP